MRIAVEGVGVLSNLLSFLFKEPSSVLKRGEHVCQRQLVNEVLGPLITEFVRNFGREEATPYQRSSNASLLVRSVKLIGHNFERSCAFSHLLVDDRRRVKAVRQS